MRKKKIMVLCLSLIFLLSVGSIAAYLTDADTKTNTTTVGGTNITIEEEFPTPPELKPGTEIPKNVKIKNNGPDNCFVRVRAVFSNEDVLPITTVDWNKTDWEYNAADKFYYYKKAIKKGESTSSLFTKLTIDKYAKPEDIKPFDVIVSAEAYQQGKFGETDYKAAWKEFQKNQK